MTGAVEYKEGVSDQIIVGVDTHQEQHVAVAIDRLGVRLDQQEAPATTCGYQEIERWAQGIGAFVLSELKARAPMALG